jgi:hypothetical protein
MTILLAINSIIASAIFDSTLALQNTTPTGLEPVGFYDILKVILGVAVLFIAGCVLAEFLKKKKKGGR